jgi:hypothetical protein
MSEDAEQGEYELLFADGFDDALLGLIQQFTKPPAACYDYRACVRVLMRRDGMLEEDAEEFMEFNVVGAWVGDATPYFLRK